MDIRTGKHVHFDPVRIRSGWRRQVETVVMYVVKTEVPEVEYRQYPGYVDSLRRGYSLYDPGRTRIA